MVSGLFIPNTETQITGCYFHYCQSLYYKISKLHLRNEYSNDPEIILILKMSFSLPLLKPEKCREGLEELKSSTRILAESIKKEKLKKYITYIEDFWFGRITLEAFSVADLPRRTNNNVESFHAQLKAKCGIHGNI